MQIVQPSIKHYTSNRNLILIETPSGQQQNRDLSDFRNENVLGTILGHLEKV